MAHEDGHTIGADDALAERYARLDRVIETMAEGLVIVDAHGRVLEVNAAAERLLRVHRGHLCGSSWHNLPWRWLTPAGEPLPPERVPFVAVLRSGRPLLGAEFMLEHADGMRAIVSLNAAPLAGGDGALTGVAATFTDVTERKLLEAQLRYQASTDDLTGLPNRIQMIDRLRVAIERPDAPGGVAVLYMDLDGFKEVNDRHGHETGDLLLTEVGLRLRSLLRPGDLIGRLGGDEFMVLIEGIEDAEAAVAAGERLRAGIRRPFSVRGHAIEVGASIGVAVSGPARPNAFTLLRAADQALYQAKRSGRDKVVLAATPDIE